MDRCLFYNVIPGGSMTTRGTQFTWPKRVIYRTYTQKR